MSIPTLLVLAFGLSMDAFAVSVSNSMCFVGLRRGQAVFTSFSFGLFQGLMPMIGYLAGRAFAQTVSAVDHWVAFILLGFIGAKMAADAVRGMRAPEQCPKARAFGVRLMLVQAFATSIDALAVGVSFAALEVNIFAAALVIAGITFVCCLVGHLLGKAFGGWLGGKAELLGGVILIGIGGKILLAHLFGS